MLHCPDRDALDRNILFHLQENARQSATELAKKLKVARSTVHERISRLERDGVILGYTAVVSPNSAERLVRALVFLQINQRHMTEVVEAIALLPEVSFCSATSGDCDLLISVTVPELEDLDAVLGELAAIPSVVRTHATLLTASKFSRPTVSAPPITGPELREIGA